MVQQFKQKLQPFVARQLFVELAISFFSVSETPKSFCRLFHDDNINLAVTLSERI
jgi:hypothetical protein